MHIILHLDHVLCASTFLFYFISLCRAAAVVVAALSLPCRLIHTTCNAPPRSGVHDLVDAHVSPLQKNASLVAVLQACPIIVSNLVTPEEISKMRLLACDFLQADCFGSSMCALLFCNTQLGCRKWFLRPSA